ncbi:hypothetical protein FHU36_004780 [Nonomuraea muscovyensis]|uniref:Condensation domain-containing protein n=1 Tax=Nonomuraea muscovyensis TaxID=1124761 RepID=A0A7X0C488_9ACTN|nr:condensation domain-containing protein [Nonomuraea muscovyensis]MBB6348235.1 hypothetical protein [Nonomuraea muscovyensis]
MTVQPAGPGSGTTALPDPAPGTTAVPGLAPGTTTVPAAAPRATAVPGLVRGSGAALAAAAVGGSTASVAFDGGDAGDGPLTWGQRAIWQAIESTAPDDHYFTFGRILPVPGTRTVEQLLAALAALVERHGSLRTRLGTGREPYQRLAARGRLEVTVTTGDPDEVLGELAAARFDYAGEWPVRAALVLTGDRVSHVVLAFCHLATDGHGAEVVLRDLRVLLLRGRAPGPPAPQPLDLARRQAGPEGRRVAEQAAAHWAGEYGRLPATMFDVPTSDVPTSDAAGGGAAGGRAADPPIWRALLRSPALDLAVRSIAAAHRTSTSTVLLTAVAALVGGFTGHERVAVLPIVANRFRRDTRGIVSTLSQEGLFALDVGGPFTDLLRAAGPAALRAYRSAYHDPADRDRITAAESARRGLPVSPRCCFNDLRFADPGPATCPPGEVLAALAQTSLSWPMSQDKLNCRFCVHVSAGGVSLTADTRYLSRADMERYLRSLEALLVEAAV